MNTTPLNTPVGFADGRVQGYHRENHTVVVRVLAWNDRSLELRFRGVVGLADMGVCELSDVHRGRDSEFLRRCMARTYDGMVPEDHPYSSYVFFDHDDNIALEVVAENVEVQDNEKGS